MGIGMIAGGLLLGAWGGFKRRIKTSLLGLVGLAAGTFFYGFAPASMYWLMIVGAAILGLTLPFTNGPIMAIVQAKVDADMQGRVITLVHSIAQVASLVSMAAAGPLADRIGVQTWFVISGVVVLLLAIGAWLTPPIRKIEDRPDASEKASTSLLVAEEAAAAL
jgi:DHA3 family macrolide efflux protein-like MFS transporter